jgi:PBSX family phage terminase large subunit
MTKPKIVKFGRYDVAEVYIPMFYDKHFTKLFYGSRNSTKSHFAALLKLIRAIELPYFKCLMVRKIKDAIKDSIYSTLKEVAERHGIDDQFEFNDHTGRITCLSNGNTFVPKGTHEVLGSGGNAKGVTNPTDALIDEMDEITESEYKSLVYSIRGSNDLEIIGIFNTNKIDEDHWIFKRWFPPTNTFEVADGSHTYIRSKRSNTIILHTNYLMNPYVSDQIKTEFEYDKKFDYEYYELDGLGLIKTVKSTHMAFKYYDPKTHIDKSIKFNPDMLVYLHWDFNRLPHHTVGLSQPQGYDPATGVYQWNIVTEFCLEDKSITEVQREINTYLRENNYMSNRVAIVCDYSGNTKRDHDSITDINKIKKELKRGGFEVVDRTKVNPSVTASLSFANDVFKEEVLMSQRSNYPGAKIRIRINPDAKFHCDDFKKTKTDKTGGILKVTQRDQFIEDGIKVNRTYQARGHAVDSWRYLLTSVFEEEYSLYKSQFIN